jgi:signal transduction histidine kinase
VVKVPETLAGASDRLRLEQVLSNLLDNAIKYGAHKPVRISLVALDEQVRITVQDDGIGIPPEDVERIFERFERAVSNRSYGGLGLGLYISRTIVEALGGTVCAASEPGQGARFTVTLPR